MRLGVHGHIGRPHPQPKAEAQTVSDAIQRAQADFVIVDAEDEYESAPAGTSKRFVEAYRRLRPEIPVVLLLVRAPEPPRRARLEGLG